MDYWVAGSQEVSPSGAHDDGRFVYLIFNNNADMPAVYQTDDSGKESLVNTHVTSGNTIVVHRLTEKLPSEKVILSPASEISPMTERRQTTGQESWLPDVERVVKEVN